MMLTLSYGYKKPENGDKGSVFFPALQDNWVRVNGHTHDGSDSAAIPAKNISKASATISSASWALVSNGIYKQTVTIAAGYSFDSTPMEFRIASNGYLVHPTVEKVTSTTFDVYFNDNSLSLTVIYG